MENEIKRIKASELTPDPRNANKGTERGRYALEASLRQYGAGRSIVVDKHGRIIAGNKTLEAAAEMGLDDVIVVQTNGTKIVAVQRMDLDLAQDETARMLAYADNRVGQLDLDFDAEVIAADLAAGLDLSALWQDFELDEIMADLQPEQTPGEDTEPQEDRAEELRQAWGVESGQLWQLGDHRLICGDCTDAAVVERVMGGEKFDLCVTSPPYNSGNGGYKTDYYGKTKRFYREDGDDRTEDEWVIFCDSVLGVCGAISASDESPVVLNVMYTARCRSGYGKCVFGGNHPFTVKETICWDKGMGFPSASKGILSRNWELVFVLSKGERYFTTQGDNEVRWAKWDISRPNEQAENHKAVFPIELPAKAIVDFSKTGAIVYEPFSGSGTTIIACENLNRKCRAVEISPGYVAVALQRWADHTGRTPELIEA